MQDLPIRAPMCPDCGTPMRFITSELDKTTPVRHMIFECNCGRASDQLVPTFFDPLSGREQIQK
jgi:hypothetical protein